MRLLVYFLTLNLFLSSCSKSNEFHSIENVLSWNDSRNDNLSIEGCLGLYEDLHLQDINLGYYLAPCNQISDEYQDLLINDKVVRLILQMQNNPDIEETLIQEMPGRVIVTGYYEQDKTVPDLPNSQLERVLFVEEVQAF